ncbi:MAG: MBL fold metallo-hydrolase [Rubrivivax sp.]|nr:MBL fold metallo-hydrolase [Rubrivivax sp.]
MANAQEAALHYPLGDTLPEPGRTLELAPGVRWLRMPLPFALDHINLWLLRDKLDGVEGWTVVDCGVATEATRALWAQIFEAELQGLPVLRVIVTHMHPDHLGLAHWLCERWSSLERACRLWISATDWNAGHLGSRRGGFDGDGAARFYALHGLVDAAALDGVRARGDYYPRLVPQVPARFRRLMDGMVLRIGGHDWHCISGYGHAPEHIALHCPATDTLISGDMVLPRISTNVSVFYLEPEANPLPLYLRSIAALRALPATTLVLPSHGKPFTGLHARIAQLQQHHVDRLAEVLAACAQAPQSAAGLLPVMFRRTLDLHQTTFAMGEAIAHVHALAEEGRLVAAKGADGVQRYRTPA